MFALDVAEVKAKISKEFPGLEEYFDLDSITPLPKRPPPMPLHYGRDDE